MTLTWYWNFWFLYGSPFQWSTRNLQLNQRFSHLKPIYPPFTPPTFSQFSTDQNLDLSPRSTALFPPFPRSARGTSLGVAVAALRALRAVDVRQVQPARLAAARRQVRHAADAPGQLRQLDVLEKSSHPPEKKYEKHHDPNGNVEIPSIHGFKGLYYRGHL